MANDLQMAYVPEPSRHYISYKKANELVNNFKKALPELLKRGVPLETFPMSELFAKNAVLEVLKQKGCAGLRIYNGLNKKNQVVYVLVGVDKNAKNINGKAIQLKNAVSKTSNSAMMMTASTTVVAPEPVILEEGMRCPPFNDDNGGV